eukprot:gene16672-22929_t
MQQLPMLGEAFVHVTAHRPAAAQGDLPMAVKATKSGESATLSSLASTYKDIVQAAALSSLASINKDMTCSEHPGLHLQRHGAAALSTLASAYRDMEQVMTNAFVVMHKLGHSSTPWGVAKNAARARQAEQDIKAQIPAIKSFFSTTVNEQKKALRIIQMLKSQIVEKELALFAEKEANRVMMEAKSKEMVTAAADSEKVEKELLEKAARPHPDALALAVEEKDELLIGSSSKQEALEQLQDHTQLKINALTLAIEDMDELLNSSKQEGLEQLQDYTQLKINALTLAMDNMDELLNSSSKQEEFQQLQDELEKTKAGHSKRVKELVSEIDARDIEMRRIQVEVRRSSGAAFTSRAKGADYASRLNTRDTTSVQLANRTSELKNLQRRFDSTKTELEYTRITQAELTKSFNEANSSLNSTQKELTTTLKKKESLEKELKLSKEQAASLRAEVVDSSRLFYDARGISSRLPDYFNATFEALSTSLSSTQEELATTVQAVNHYPGPLLSRLSTSLSSTLEELATTVQAVNHYPGPLLSRLSTSLSSTLEELTSSFPSPLEFSSEDFVREQESVKVIAELKLRAHIELTVTLLQGKWLRTSPDMLKTDIFGTPGREALEEWEEVFDFFKGLEDIEYSEYYTDIEYSEYYAPRDQDLNNDELQFVGKAAFKTHHGVFVSVSWPFGIIRGEARKILAWEWVSVYYVECRICFALKSHLGQWLSATPWGTLEFRGKVREWELFHVEMKGDEEIEKACIRSHHLKFLCAEPDGRIVANRDEALDFEMFEVHWQNAVDAGGLREDQLKFVGEAAIKTHHGVFVTVFPDGNIRGLAKDMLSWERVSVYFVQSLERFALKSHLGEWLSVTPNGSLEFRGKVREWELFHVDMKGDEEIEKACIRGSHGKFLCAEQDGRIVANRDEALDFELFEVHWQSGPHF